MTASNYIRGVRGCFFVFFFFFYVVILTFNDLESF